MDNRRLVMGLRRLFGRGGLCARRDAIGRTIPSSVQTISTACVMVIAGCAVQQATPTQLPPNSSAVSTSASRAPAPSAPSASNPPAPMKDFSFGKGAPFEGSTSTECGLLTLSSKNTEPFGLGSFRNNPSGKSATVTVKFSRPIREFRLAVSYVRSDEYLGGFSVAPTDVSGTLTQGAARVSTSRPSMADDGAGTIVWSNLHTDVLTFEVGGPSGTALAMDTFMVDCDR